jgi:phosphate transport system protein
MESLSSLRDIVSIGVGQACMMLLVMSFRSQYDTKLAAIRAAFIHMGGLAVDMVRMAVEATLTNDHELARKVIAMDDEVDRMVYEALEQAAMTVMTEQPVASDSRMLASALGIMGEIERAADDATKLAERSMKLSGMFPSEMKRPLSEMSEEVRKVFAASLRLFSDYDHDLALQLRSSDNNIDMLYTHARSRIYELIQENPKATEHLIRAIEIFHALEHVGDHAEEIAKRLMLHYEPHTG